MSLTTPTISVNTSQKGTQASPSNKTEPMRGRAVTLGSPHNTKSLLALVRDNPPKGLAGKNSSSTPPSLAVRDVTTVQEEDKKITEVDTIPQQSKLDSAEDFTLPNEPISTEPLSIEKGQFLEQIETEQFSEQVKQYLESQSPEKPESQEKSKKEKKKTLRERANSFSQQLLRRTPPPSPVMNSKKREARHEDTIPAWSSKEVENHLANQGSIIDIADELSGWLKMTEDLNGKIAILNNLRKVIGEASLPTAAKTAEKIFSQDLKAVISDIEGSNDPSAALQSLSSAVIAKLITGPLQGKIAPYYSSLRGRFCEILACCSPKERLSISLTDEILEDLSNCPDVSFAIQILTEREKKFEETMALMIKFCTSRENDVPEGVIRLGTLYVAEHPLKRITSYLKQLPDPIVVGVLSLQADPSSIAQIASMISQKPLKLFLMHQMLKDDDNKVFPEYLKRFSATMQWHVLTLLDKVDELRTSREKILLDGLVHELRQNDPITFSAQLKTFSPETQNNFFNLFDSKNAEHLASDLEGRSYASIILNVKIKKVKEHMALK